MKPIYMPFTHLQAPTARVVSALLGPFAVYQPIETRISDDLAALADQGLLEIRTPLAGDDQRLKAALSEFTQWAAQNPGRSTPGAGFIGSLQGTVPFFDDKSIQRIRSEIKCYDDRPADADDRDPGFSARLFLAVAEDNDRATTHLDRDLKDFEALEQGFLASLGDGDEAAFSRRGTGTGTWVEDRGARHTEQRLRAWATLAAADAEPSDIWITSSPAVVATLMDIWGESVPLMPLRSLRLPVPFAGQTSALYPVLTELATRQSLDGDAGDALSALAEDRAGHAAVAVSVYAAVDCPPVSMIRRMVPAAVTPPEKSTGPAAARNTLIVLVEPDSKSD